MPGSWKTGGRAVIRFLIALLVLWATVLPATAQGLTALARPDVARSAIVDRGRDVTITLDLSQPVPYRLRHLEAPYRFVLDFREVSWRGVAARDLDQSEAVAAVQVGSVRPGWSRMVLELARPMVLTSAEMVTDPATGRALMTVVLTDSDGATFAARAAALSPTLPGTPLAVDLPDPLSRQDGSRPLRVVLDPGHGGLDPGAERDDIREADLMLTLALELREALLRAGFEVALTRTSDDFVPLEARVSAARHARADVFLSLHADAVSEGRASGATVYTLSDSASDEAAQRLAERHDRMDLLAGVDLRTQDDVVAGVLMDLARTETAPRSEALAEALVAELKGGIGRMHKRPHQRAGFSVLKAPDIPSVLVELGFLSSPRDRKNLTDPAWRARAVAAIRDALLTWAQSDAAQARLIRQ